MVKKRWLIKKILNARFWWIVFAVALLTAAWQVWSTIPHSVISHEIMGRANDEQEVRLIFVGDTGTGDANQQNVAKFLEEICLATNPAGIVFLGDNFYNIGVESVSDPLWESRFEQMYSGECLKNQAFYAVLGNHDYRSVPDAQIIYTRHRGGRWTMPARFYSLQFAQMVEIGAADTSIPDRCGIASLCSVDWLIEKLRASNARWKILIGHHPILSGGKYRSLKGLGYLTLPELYCKSGASVYISGHDHGLQHLHGRHPAANCKIEQIVSGGGGASLYDIEKIPEKTLFSASAHGFVLGRFTSDEQRYEFYTLNNNEPAYIWSGQREKQ